MWDLIVGPRPILRLSALLVVAALGLLSFSWLTAVTDQDIFAYHVLDQSVEDDILEPGSIVALGRRGGVTRICSLDARAVDRGQTFSSLYYNKLREDFPSYIRALSQIRRSIEETGREAIESVAFLDLDGRQPRYGREFTGRILKIDDLTRSAAFENEVCERKMAEHLSLGYRACTVKKSLVTFERTTDGTLRPRTVAVDFADHSNFVSEETFAALGIEYTPAAAAANGKECGVGLSWLALLRYRIQAIDRVGL